MFYRVIYKNPDGKEEIFGEFISKDWAYYHIALAKAPHDGCKDYSKGTFTVQEVKEEN